MKLVNKRLNDQPVVLIDTHNKLQKVWKLIHQFRGFTALKKKSNSIGVISHPGWNLPYAPPFRKIIKLSNSPPLKLKEKERKNPCTNMENYLAMQWFSFVALTILACKIFWLETILFVEQTWLSRALSTLIR